AAAAASGDGKAAGAALMGGVHLAERTLLQYNRGQESAADQAALTYLDRTGQSSLGLLLFFEVLIQQELLSAVRQDPYLRSHPLTRERMDAVRAHVARSRYAAVRDPPELQARHERMIAKLRGFLQPPLQTLRDYPESDRSVPARYARAVALFRMPKVDQAVAEIDSLIAEHPADPYFHELKGQILFESGRLGPAIPAYREAHRLAPDEALIRTSLAQALIETNDNAVLPEARALLNEALRLEDRNAFIWRMLAIVHGREGNIGLAALALAEQAAANNDRRNAIQQAGRAMQQLPTGSPAWLRAEDIQRQARKTPPTD
ncbi:MAG: tetratricopeptide repeat protein, partial [Alphaproteobacteria bacterium]